MRSIIIFFIRVIGAKKECLQPRPGCPTPCLHLWMYCGLACRPVSCRVTLIENIWWSRRFWIIFSCTTEPASATWSTDSTMATSPYVEDCFTASAASGQCICLHGHPLCPLLLRLCHRSFPACFLQHLLLGRLVACHKECFEPCWFNYWKWTYQCEFQGTST